MSIWGPIIEVASPFVRYLSDGLSDGFRNSKAVKDAEEAFVNLIESTKEVNKPVFAKFAGRVE